MSSVVNKILDLSAALGLYDLWARHSLTRVHETLVQLADLRGNEEILDVGCGTGLLISRFAQSAEGIVVRGMDIGSRMIGVARKKAAGHCLNVEYRIATAARLPYANGQFDMVSSCLLLHLLERSDKELALREIFRVLKHGGRYASAEFETYPVGFSCRRLSEYPGDLVAAVGFDVHRQEAGPSITRRRPVVYRVLVKPD
jgi:ubiquinone/menaquinone biosynthesis C-methylase UbiE